MYELYTTLYAKYQKDMHPELEVISPDPNTLNLYFKDVLVGRFHSAFNCITEMLHLSARLL